MKANDKFQSIHVTGYLETPMELRNQFYLQNSNLSFSRLAPARYAAYYYRSLHNLQGYVTLTRFNPIVMIKR